MIYLSHGYIDIFSHEISYDNSKRLRLATKTNENILKEDINYNYNSKVFLDKVLEKIISELNHNNNFKQVQLEKSILKFSPKNQPHTENSYHEYYLNLKLQPFDDTAHITFDEFVIIASFKNHISYIKKDLIKNKKFFINIDESKLIRLPEHCIQISLDTCNSYNSFKSTILNAIYKDITSFIIKEIKTIILSRWNIVLNNDNLDIENLIKDNFKIIAA